MAKRKTSEPAASACSSVRTGRGEECERRPSSETSKDRPSCSSSETCAELVNGGKASSAGGASFAYLDSRVCVQILSFLRRFACPRQCHPAVTELLALSLELVPVAG